jgi:hypothetical protein
MHMAGSVVFGIFVLPFIASTVVCIVIALARLVIPFPGETNFMFFWWGALIVGVPASLIGTVIGTLIFALMDQNRPIRCIALGAVAGAAIGYIGYGMLDANFLSMSLVGARAAPRAASSFFFTIAAVTGCISGSIFGLVSYLFHDITKSPESTDDTRP